MRIDIEPTPEIYDVPVYGDSVPTRIWRGRTSGGVEIEVYVISIIPNPASEDTVERLKAELPSFMRPTREAMTIDVDRDDEENR